MKQPDDTRNPPESTATRLSPSIEADAEHLLLSSDLSKAQFGMRVEDARASDSGVTIRTTGADFVFEPASGSLNLSQRLARERSAASVAFPPGCLDNLKLEGSESGAVLLSAGGGRLKLRINGDSLLMLQSSEPLTLTCSVAFRPAVVRQFRGNVMFLDECGGFGAYPATGHEPVCVVTGNRIRYEFAAGQVLWISVAPPRPYRWEQSLRDRVVWHHDRILMGHLNETGYPTDSEIEAWSRYGNLLLQQSEVMLWKDWSLRFIPRDGVAEFERVVRTCRRFGMRNYVYTSPFYFLPGTGLEDKAMNTFENFTGFSPGDGRGVNWPLFVEEIRRVMREYRPAGLYFDGIYNNVVRTYIVARKGREAVGDDGILEYHATLDAGPCQHTPPGGGLFLPQIDAYFDFILRGEGQHDEYKKDEFLRYTVSTYNISNSIGVLCDNYNYQLEAAFVDRLLDYNIRLHGKSWSSEEQQQLMAEHYFPKLNDSLRVRVEAKAP
jgi:hypothetical protein